jgi:hypothetical protein
VTVLIDPKQPDYAEVPGTSFVTSWQSIGLIIAGLLIGGLAVLEARRMRRLAHRAQPKAQGLP